MFLVLTRLINNNNVIFFLAESCSVLFTRGRRSSGLYNLRKPDIPVLPKNQRYLRMWCDMQGPNGGWILLQQRSNATFNFSRNWFSYEKGFGQPGFEFWLGNRYMHAITFNRRHVLRIEKHYIDWRNQTLFAEYDNFQVLSPFTDYILRVGKYRGNLGDILSVVNNSPFSTWDRDNDKKAYRSCARINEGAWWYGNTCDIQDLNSVLGNITEQGLVRITMKAKELLGGNVLRYTAVSRKSVL